MLKNKEILIKLINEVWNKGNFSIIDELVSPEYFIKHDPGDPGETKILDLETFRKRVMLARNTFEDLQFNIQDFVCENDKIAISWFMTGKHKNDIPNIPATGKKFNMSGMTIYYFLNNKICGHWQISDRLGLFQQLKL